MTLLKQLLLLAALLLLSIVPTETEVVASVEKCNEFFLQQTPPNITRILERGKIFNQNRYKLICQTLNDTRTFVTLYDTQNKIPVFSAAKFNGNISGRPDIWMIEPQLENTTDNPNMRPSNNSIDYENQAGDKDYKHTGFSRGHLFPNSYGSTDLKKNSTFTLTNIVPQNEHFNGGSWRRMEECIKCVLNEYCINNNGNIEGFVVTGAQPSNNSLNNRINIPSVLWSAFCCYSHSKNSWLSSAHWGNNTDHKPEHLETRTLGELITELEIEGSLMMHHLLPFAALLLLSIIPTETKVVTSVEDCDDLKTSDEDDNMRRADNNIIYKHQDVNTDYDPYNQQKFGRGHLFPNSYACDLTEKISTFTLTNAVPQKSHFYRGNWNQMEKCVKRFLDENCINNNKKIEGFVVIGAKPSDSASSDSSLLNNNKINIPSVLWSAFCCYSSSQKKWLAGAHWGENRDDHHKYLETKTLGALYTTLGIEAFPGTRGPEDLTTQVY
ncbi:unnamed protein product [Oreochromis niloticus]|nr:unnamed protein product [Mustela putorius furo]